MYTVKYGNKYLHDPLSQNNTILIDLSLSQEENSCGYCDFTIEPNHPMYDKLVEHDIDNLISVYDGETLLFCGFIYELGKEFYLSGTVRCKGELAFLTESVVRPYSTDDRAYGVKVPTSISGYFQWLIEQHNAQVKPNEQFQIGENQGNAMSYKGSIYVENDDYPTTMDEISNKLINDDSIGGYLQVRHEGDVRYIDYLYEWVDVNTQILDFGVNLTDYTLTDDSENLATFIVPIGTNLSNTNYSYNDGYFITSDRTPQPNKIYYTKNDGEKHSYTEHPDLTYFEPGVTYYEYDYKKDESNKKLTIADNDRPIDNNAIMATDIDEETKDKSVYRRLNDMIYNEDAVGKYGWIGITYTNSDIDDVDLLGQIGLALLKQSVSPKRTIEIKAVDMHLINPNIKPLRIGEYVRVRSRPHGLDSYFLCTSIDLDLNNPENSTYTLGVSFDTLTGEQNRRIVMLNKTINSQYEAAAALSLEEIEKAKKAAADAQNTADTARQEAGQAQQDVNEAKDDIIDIKDDITDIVTDIDGLYDELITQVRRLDDRIDDIQPQDLKDYVKKVEIYKDLNNLTNGWSQYVTSTSTLYLGADGTSITGLTRKRVISINVNGVNIYDCTSTTPVILSSFDADAIKFYDGYDSGTLYSEFNRNGLYFYDGRYNKLMASFTRSGIDLYKTGSNYSYPIASFSSSNIYLGGNDTNPYAPTINFADRGSISYSGSYGLVLSSSYNSKMQFKATHYYANTGKEIAFPIASGTGGGWSYIKYSNGTAEMWKHLSIESFNCTTEWGSLYWSGDPYFQTGDMPFRWESQPTFYLTAEVFLGGNGAYGFAIMCNQISEDSDAGPTFCIASGRSYGGLRADVDILIKGDYQP